MKRRSFLARLFGGAVVLTTVNELQAKAPVESVQEIQEGKHYLVKIDYAPPDKCKDFEFWLRANGINATVVSGPFELFEVETRKS